MPTENKLRRGASQAERRAFYVELAAELERLLASEDATTQGQFDLLTDELLDLSNTAQVNVYSPGVVTAFLLAVTGRKGPYISPNLYAIRETVRLINEGEKFEDYVGDDGYHKWKLRRQGKEHGVEKQIAGMLERALANPKSPAHHCFLLLQNLCDFARLAVTEYDEQRPRETYLDAAGGLAARDDEGARAARSNIVELLRGIQKGLATDDLNLREVPKAGGRAVGKRPAEEQPERPGDRDARLSELRDRLGRLDNEDDQIIRCTERMRIETEIYNLEHPEDLDDWSAWEDPD